MFVAVADDDALGRFQEHVRHAPVGAPCGNGLLLGLRVSAAFPDMAEEVHGRVQDLPRIEDRRQRAHLRDVVDVAGPWCRRDAFVGGDVVDDLVQAELEAVLVLADEVEHRVGHREARIRGVALERPIGGGELDNQLVLQDDADALVALDLEGAELEGLRGGRGRPALRQERRGVQKGDDQQTGDRSSHGTFSPCLLAFRGENDRTLTRDT